jgi:hypothetical protein
MSTLFETGVWTASGSTPQTVTLANGSLTPIAIIVWTTHRAAAPAAGAFAASSMMSIGFGTRRGGATQSGCVGIFNTDAVTTSANGRVYNTTLLHIMATATTTDYTVSLSSFGAGSFTVTYSSAANSSADIFHYMVFGGTDLTDAIVINQLMNSVGATQSVTGAGFQPNVVFGLDAQASATAGTLVTNMAMSFGCATSSTQSWCVSNVATNGDTTLAAQNWNRGIRSDAFIERLTINADTTDARWNLNTFTSDGATLDVVDAPTTTTLLCPLLFIQGGTWEAGSKAKITTTGTDTFTLANASLVMRGVIMACNSATAVGVGTANTTLVVGAGSTPNATRASAINGVCGVVGPEAATTTADRFRATDSVIEELTGGTTPAETSEAHYSSAGTGTFAINWAVNGGSAALITYLAIGDTIPIKWEDDSWNQRPPPQKYDAAVCTWS